ncbi:unnamed protein product [Candida verbasci]|uniref:Small ribosomal subunit protein mS35 mitochondrial conserved domain-containing protein n=1 Tax=Candida verbasci TaxID=1227364 RepID=A0A9W4TV04_9ASCO|nr:unnamed protein product [Candida verbasci]
MKSVIPLARSFSTTICRLKPLYLNPHAWKDLPADQIFELHETRKKYLGDAYNPTNEERTAILSTVSSLVKNQPTLDYAYEIENFKERLMNNTPMKDRGKPQKLNNQFVIDNGAIPHNQRRIENLNRVAAFEIPLLAKYRQPYQPKPKYQTPLKLIYQSDFSNETNSQYNRLVKLEVKLRDLELDLKQEYKFKVLAGKHFNHDLNTFKLKSDRHAEVAQNVNYLVSTFNKLLTEAKDLTDDMSDVPLDKRHMKTIIGKKQPQFPKEWEKQEDAPVKRHRIIEHLIKERTRTVDESFINSLSP